MDLLYSLGRLIVMFLVLRPGCQIRIVGDDLHVDVDGLEDFVVCYAVEYG
jgi:hypothetical protein